MSREEQLISANAPDDAAEPSSDDIRLQIDVRLRLDEVAAIEAEQLLAQSRRAPARRELCRLACRIYDARRARDRVLDRKLFGEPAWDMLLALYCLPARGERLRVTALTHAAGVPVTTGHRWQQILLEKGLIERGPEGMDARKQLVRLTETGRKLLEDYLTRLFYYDAPVPPSPESDGG